MDEFELAYELIRLDVSYLQSKELYTYLMEKFINGIIDGQKFEE